MLFVAKFGGSSLSSETQFQKVKKIVEDHPARRVIVVSALGKRAHEDNKLTDLLYLLYAHIKHGVSFTALWETIEQRFLTVKQELGLTYDLARDLEALKNELAHSSLTVDYLVSRGEYLTAKLMSEYLGYKFVDAKDVIMFAPNGKVDLNASRQKLTHLLAEDFKIVIPGFYGAYPNGKIKLLDRGGSDITGSIVANCLQADKYENWTDVPGILMADPRIIPTPVPIASITYEELSELSYMGANVLHEEAIYPIRQLNIPIHIKNTNEPDANGTLICDQTAEKSEMITGIAGKKDFVSITIYKNHMSSELGFLSRVMDIFKQFNINIEHVPTGIDNIGVIVSAASVEKCLYDLTETLKVQLKANEVSVKEQIALITVVGKNMISSIGLSGTIFQALGQEQIRVLLIAQSPRGLNVVIGVQNDDYIPAIQILYKELVECHLG